MSDPRVKNLGLSDDQLVHQLRYPNREWTDLKPIWRRDTAPDKWTLAFNQIDFGAVSCEHRTDTWNGHYAWFLGSRLKDFPASVEQGKLWIEAFFRVWARHFWIEEKAMLFENLKEAAVRLTEDYKLQVSQLNAISQASLQNKEFQLKERLPEDDPLWTIAYGDVCTAVDREIMWRQLADRRREMLQYFLQCWDKGHMTITGLDVLKLRELSA